MAVVLPDSHSSIKTDPLRNFKFLVNIHHTLVNRNGKSGGSLATLGFMNCSGLNIETSVIAYREGGYNTTPQKMPGQSEFTPITLSRGVILGGPSSHKWMREIFSVVQGGGLFSLADGRDFRSSIDIKVLAHPHTNQKNVGTPVKAWFKVYNAWPASIGFSDLDAGGNAVFMEQMVLQHEGWNLAWAANNLASEAKEPQDISED
jgi:phage tail-like protein